MKFQLIVLFSLILTVFTRSYRRSTCIQSEGSQPSTNGLVGSEQPLTIEMLNSVEITQAALNGTHLYNKKINPTDYYYKLAYVKSGTKQIVSGVIYRLDVTLQKTECFKNDFFDENGNGLLSTQTYDKIEDCNMDQKKMNTILKILYQPWNPLSYSLV